MKPTDKNWIFRPSPIGGKVGGVIFTTTCTRHTTAWKRFEKQYEGTGFVKLLYELDGREQYHDEKCLNSIIRH